MFDEVIKATRMGQGLEALWMTDVFVVLLQVTVFRVVPRCSLVVHVGGHENSGSRRLGAAICPIQVRWDKTAIHTNLECLLWAHAEIRFGRTSEDRASFILPPVDRGFIYLPWSEMPRAA